MRYSTVHVHETGFIQVMESLESRRIVQYLSFSRPGKSWNLSVGHGKSWKMTENYLSENNRASTCNTLDER